MEDFTEEDEEMLKAIEELNCPVDLAKEGRRPIKPIANFGKVKALV